MRMEPFVVSVSGIAQCLCSHVLFWSDDGVYVPGINTNRS